MTAQHGAAWIVSAAVWLWAIGSAEAASFSLTPEQRAEAVTAGKQSIVADNWTGEWLVAEKPGQFVMVMTPFHRLALAARNSAFKQEELKPKDIESLVKNEEGRLTLWAVLRGPKVDFARHFQPALLVGAQEIKASFVQNERTALREEDGRYTARCLYVFPAEAVDPRSNVTLLIRDLEAKPVARFTVNLSGMR